MNTEILTFREACEYVKVNPSTMRKYCMKKVFSYYKPNNGRVYFKISELEKWLQEKRISSRAEVERKAIDYVIKNRVN